MKPTVRWYPALLMRDARGRFTRVRVARPPKRRRVAHHRSPKARPSVLQLVLF